MLQVCESDQRITTAAPTDQKLPMTFSTVPLLPVKSPSAAACCVPNTCAPKRGVRRHSQPAPRPSANALEVNTRWPVSTLPSQFRTTAIPLPTLMKNPEDCHGRNWNVPMTYNVRIGSPAAVFVGTKNTSPPTSVL